MLVQAALNPGAACDAGRCRSRAPRPCGGWSCSCGRSSWPKLKLSFHSP